jgi:hypothetical protein
LTCFKSGKNDGSFFDETVAHTLWRTKFVTDIFQIYKDTKNTLLFPISLVKNHWLHETNYKWQLIDEVEIWTYSSVRIGSIWLLLLSYKVKWFETVFPIENWYHFAFFEYIYTNTHIHRVMQRKGGATLCTRFWVLDYS